MKLFIYNIETIKKVKIHKNHTSRETVKYMKHLYGHRDSGVVWCASP